MHNRQSVRLISGDVWEKIKQIFPKTLDHSFEPKKMNATGNCVQCHLDAEDERLFPQNLKEWKSMALQPPLLCLTQNEEGLLSNAVKFESHTYTKITKNSSNTEIRIMCLGGQISNADSERIDPE